MRVTDYFNDQRVAPAVNGLTDGDDGFEDEIGHQLMLMLAKEEAKRRFAERSGAEVPLPSIRNLAELLAEPDVDTAYLIEGVAPAGGRALLAAQAKTGKTTLVGNLVRSLVDGEPFLCGYAVNRRAKRVVVIDTELSENMVRRWFRDQGIVNTDRVDVVALRGRVGSFNILNPDRRQQWAELFGGADYLILDCLRPALDALGLDEHRDAGKFLVAFDALLAEAGITDALLVHHMGHAGERARGDSRLQDWPDVLWRLLRANDDPDSDRFFTAFGRDVDVPEGRLDFESQNRRLTYTVGSRKSESRQADRDEVLGEIVGIMAQRLAEGNTDPMSRNDILAATEKHKRSARTIDPALGHGVIQSVLSKTKGPRNSHLYSLVNPCTVCRRPVPDVRRDTHDECGVNGD